MPPPKREIRRELERIRLQFELLEKTFSKLEGQGKLPLTKSQKFKNGMKKFANFFKSDLFKLATPKVIKYRAVIQPEVQPAALANLPLRNALMGHLRDAIKEEDRRIKADNLDRAATEGMRRLLEAMRTGKLADYKAFYEHLTKYGVFSRLESGKEGLAFYSTDGLYAAAVPFAKTGGAIDGDMTSFKLAAKMGQRVRAEDPADPNMMALYRQFMGIQSALFATLARGNVICFLPKGISYGNIFWSNELPILRSLQRQGIVDEILVYRDGSPPEGLPKDVHGNLQKVKKKSARRRYRHLWYEKAISLTSHDVEVKLLGEGYDEKGDKIVLHKFHADLFVRWLLAKSNVKGAEGIVLYAYRMESGVYTKILQDGGDEDWKLEFRTPKDPNVVKEMKIKQCPKAELPKKLKTIERFLMANFTKFGHLPLSPRYLLFSADAIFEVKRPTAKLLAMQVGASGEWQYEDAIRTKIRRDYDAVKRLIDGKTRREQSPEELAERLHELRTMMA